MTDTVNTTAMRTRASFLHPEIRQYMLDLCDALDEARAIADAYAQNIGTERRRLEAALTEIDHWADLIPTSVIRDILRGES